MTTRSIINNINWDRVSHSTNNWIRLNDIRYQYLRNELINKIFPILRVEDKNLLLDGLVKVINLIYFKFGFASNDQKNESLLWDQLLQNNLLDLRALINIMLPFINDNENDDKKHKLKRLADLYIEQDERGYVYTNSQYNRCIRHVDNGQIRIFQRPFLKEYFTQHLELLLMSIETCANKLYVNWVDVLPIKMNEYNKTKLYNDTISKIVGSLEQDPDGNMVATRNQEISSVDLINNYIDPGLGISFQDFYNVMSNHLYHEIKNHKWLIYDIIIAGSAVSYITYLEGIFNLDSIWRGLLWSQLDTNIRNGFIYQWNNFLGSINPNDNIILNKFYFFFSKYHKNATKLINKGELVLTFDPATQEDEDEENARITPESTRNAKLGMSKVPAEEIYLFFFDQLTAFRKSWFYYSIKIKKNQYLGKKVLTGTDIEIYITPKNIYNYCKSLVHYVAEDIVTKKSKFIEIPKHWYSLKPELIEMILIRMLDISNPPVDSGRRRNENEEIDPYDRLRNDWTRPNWFNINKYLRRLYPSISERQLPAANFLIHSFIRTKIVDIVFESLIYHGLLSDFRPNKKITNNSIVESLIGSTDDRRKADFKREQMKEFYFSGQNRKDYEDNAYYFITSSTYGELDPLKSKDYNSPTFERKYFDFLSSAQIWTFTYAMNWVSQINFYHHYMNDRVMYITGATGVGKSTQVPKLLMYSQKMLDYNSNGKIICTQPRVPPTVENADTISRELGVPIRAYEKLYDKNIFTSNYYVQYKHQKEEHLEKTDSFLRIVTDGTLYEEIKASPFLTRSSPDPYAVNQNEIPIDWAKTFLSGNKYDIVIVDEAHEHNANMDMILTLARDAVYVNNSLKLVIVSATMEDDEPIYRRYYRTINDNRAFPLSAFIENQQLDRANMDRRIHISPPGATTQYVIKDVFLSKAESELINEKNFVDYGIEQTIKIANTTTEKDILLFMSGQADIQKAVREINARTPANIIAMGYYSELSEETKTMIVKIHQTLPFYTRYKEDVFLEENDVNRRVPPGTYNRAIIIATNVAEASITLQNLRYVVDTGYAKTVVYDALEGVPKTLVLPISWSSAQQRRGRVGRVASGEVYYMYEKAKIINNKTAYKIADSNAKDHIIPILKTDPNDSAIITRVNDINDIHNLLEIIDRKESGLFEASEVIYDILKNPRPYLDIIKKQYMYIADLTDINQYYVYYGKTDTEEYDTNSLVSNMEGYMLNNHDDYHYQMDAYQFRSKAYTGYDENILEDRALSFYIIHPDENVIRRNLYTGKMEAIKCNPSVTESYYYYLLKINGIQFTTNDIKTCNFREINFKDFVFLKYRIAIDDAKLQLLVVDVPGRATNPVINYTNITEPNIRYYVNLFYNFIKETQQGDWDITVKSTQFENISNIQRLSSLTILNDVNYLLWYCYSIPYQLEEDVLAIISMLTLVTDISQWIGITKSKKDIQRFFNTHLNRNGDIYFVWRLWNTIKELLERQNLFDITKVDVSLETLFRNYKEQYLRSSKIPFEQFLIFDKMFKSGQLNVRDEFYYYVSQISFDFKEIIQKTGIDKYLAIIAKDQRLNVERLQDFLVGYFDILFTQNKKRWMYQYEIENQLTEEPVEINVIEWAQRKLSLPGIVAGANYTPSKWDRMIEIYIRSFSMNLLKSEGNYYLRINKGVRLDPAYWSKRLEIEKTFLNNKTEFMIYHSNQSIGDTVNAAYLTPIMLEWALQLNPIYYYYFFFDKNNLLYNMEHDEDVLRSIDIIQKNKHLFDYNALLSYLDQIGNPILSNIIREAIYENRNL
ncbi:putative ATP-dependent RNA helicase [Tupanvirus soda lake]|uniref:RNA helicase n=2 Tax=Tupanvirus TaxID=2094720 RepID=A0A6N1NKU7_9VIRU|nr:putative ATP-dependent RNA helicase [Tupanvirus soda lake]QKU35185.1 putative ATP-dependent RNA helicase [Tupanvirus soda lake]